MSAALLKVPTFAVPTCQGGYREAPFVRNSRLKDLQGDHNNIFQLGNCARKHFQMLMPRLFEILWNHNAQNRVRITCKNV